MVAYAKLSEEEMYLYCIMQDPAGIDLAEFCWTDFDQPDNCWRAWAFQYPWWRCPDQRQIDQSARSIGKSTGIAARAFSWPFRSPGAQMAIIAPQLNHLRPLNTLIEQRLTGTRLSREIMRPGNKAVTHPGQALQAEFLNGATLFTRIPGADGKSAKGIHPKVLECDEAQDLPEAVWNELIETVKREVEGSKWLVHGVTRGVHDRFFKFSQPGSGWTVHRITGMSRPGWSEEERQAKMEEYGGYDTPDYKRNVLGLHGDQTSPLFTARSLFACVDDDETSDFNVNEYRRIDIYGESLGEGGESILYSLDHPANHLSGKYDQFWIGMDIGHTVAPSEILVFGEHKPKGRDGDSTLRVLLRIHMVRVGIVEQLEAMLWVIKSYGPKAFGMDATGAGLPFVQMIQNKLQESDDAELRKALEVIKGYNFSEKIVVDFDDTKDPDLGEDNEIKRNVGDFSFDTLRVLVDQKRIELPWDRELISEFQASSFTITGSATSVNEYGKRTYSSSKADHALDAARMAVLAYQQHKIEAMLRPQRRESVYLGFISN